jgi:UDP-N-acetyl-2-amino-2-deoxyglucuronate dehydrogenase
MAKKYGIGIVGAGFIGGMHADAVALLPNATVKAVLDNIPERAKAFGLKLGVPGLTNPKEFFGRDDIDVVTIATPSGLHGEAAIASAEHGKHCIVEKPIEITLKKIDAVISAHKKAGTQVGGIFNGRFCEPARIFRRAVDEGRFGKPTFGIAYCPWWRSQEYYDGGGWRGTWDLDGGGSYMNQGIHTVDLLQWLMGPVKSVMAYTDMLAHERIEVEDTGVAAIRFANGALGSIICVTSSFPGHFRQVEVCGTKGTACLSDTTFMFWQFAEERPSDDEVRQKHLKIPTVGLGASNPAAGMTPQPHAENFAEFLAALDEGRRPLVDGQEARKAVEIILAIYKSAKEGREVTLPLSG